MQSKRREAKKSSISKAASQLRLSSRKAAAATMLSSTSAADAEGHVGRGERIREVGDHINTRLQEIHQEEAVDEEVGLGASEARANALRAEARLQAGTGHREAAQGLRRLLAQQQEQTTTSSSSTVSSLDSLHHLPTLFIGHNNNSITAIAAMGDSLVVLGDKSGKVYVVNTVTSVKELLSPVLSAAVCSLAVSDTTEAFLLQQTGRGLFEKSTDDGTECQSYIAAGTATGPISVWKTLSRQHLGLLCLHRKAVTSLVFRQYTSTLLSVSDDQTLRVWDVTKMVSMDQLFGHEGPVNSVAALRRNTCVTVGDDATMRFWRLDLATQQAYAASPDSNDGGLRLSLDAVAMVSETVVFAGSRQGDLYVFDINRRKPVCHQPRAHGEGCVGDGTGLERVALAMGRTSPVVHPNPITAVAAVMYGDVCVSASTDGYVRLWELVGAAAMSAAASAKPSTPRGGGSNAAAGAPRLLPLSALPVRGIIAALLFSPTGDRLLIAAAKEPRRGRWMVQRDALNRVYVVGMNPTALLTEDERKKGFASSTAVPRHIEHLPAQLYDFVSKLPNSDEEPSEEEEEEELNASFDAEADRDEEEAQEEQLQQEQPVVVKSTKKAAARKASTSSRLELDEDGVMRFAAPSSSSLGGEEEEEEEAGEHGTSAKKKQKKAQGSSSHEAAAHKKTKKAAAPAKKLLKKKKK